MVHSFLVVNRIIALRVRAPDVAAVAVEANVQRLHIVADAGDGLLLSRPTATRQDERGQGRHLELLEQQIIQLPVQEQLKLIAHISERLSTAAVEVLRVARDKDTLQQQREREADEILALCDAAADMWEGAFDAAHEIREMRQERDEQIRLSKS